MMAGRERPRQLPLALGHDVQFSREDLIVSPANAAAVALVERWPDWPSPVVVIAGPAGSGKSHIAEVWREVSDAARLDAPDFAGAVAQEGPFLIDAVDERPFDEAALFHLINAVRTSGTHLLMTARRFPAAWGTKLPDLASRLKAATTVEIDEPDDVLLAGVITKLFADRQVAVEPHVVQFLVRRIERSLDTAIRIVDQLDRLALEQQSRITRALAASVVSAADAGQGELDL